MGGMGGRQRKRDDVIPSGAKIVVGSLKSSAHLNGRRGQVLQYDDSRQRYVCQLDNDEQIALKPSNITQLVGNCTVSGVGSKPELNGQRGAVLGWDEEKGRYQLRMASGGVIALRPSNVIVPNGAHVSLIGLKSAQHNGKIGRVVSFDNSNQRYLVMLSGGAQMKLKLENVKL